MRAGVVKELLVVVVNCRAAGVIVPAPGWRCGAVLAVLALAVSIFLGTVSPSNAGTATTLFRSPEPITGFAADARLMSWTTGACPKVTVATISLRKRSTFRSPICGVDAAGIRLALGRQALWVGVDGGGSYEAYVSTAWLKAPKARRVNALHSTVGLIGDVVTSLSGRGATLAYGHITVEEGEGCFSTPDGCEWRTISGGVKLVSRGKESVLPGAPPALLLAARRGAVALVEAPANWMSAPSWPPPLAAGATVEIRDVPTGALRSTYIAHGTPLALALYDNRLLVLSTTAGGEKQLEIATSSGVLLQRIPVATRTMPDIAVWGKRALLRTGRALRVVDLRTGDVQLVARTNRPIVGHSILGSRALWAESNEKRGRIRETKLGRP
jgi:hypothetical protein